jgi:hypothetical protein
MESLHIHSPLLVRYVRKFFSKPPCEIRTLSIPKITCLPREIGNIGEQGVPVPLCCVQNNVLLLSLMAPWIDIWDYSTFSDKIKVSRLRGEGT